ncbi:MAG: SDR family NAD(P)-dependent oxidoreductase [Leptolyngbyaceae cyanobacterium MO_188.B28]|nr:SDR family NAD(P)-dependent oxidoreductase [Leptolyngbyaceae cyanobacterium MO_188.B28]
MAASLANNSICFSNEDMALFSCASHDKNPLHLSEEYARKTPYANRVVFGVLGGLTCLGRLQNRPDFILSKITLDFPGAMFSDVPYSVEINDHSPDRATAKIYDGKRLLLKLKAHFYPGDSSLRLGPPPPKNSALDEASPLGVVDLKTDYLVKGEFFPSMQAFHDLNKRLGLIDKGLSEVQIATLLWSSYLVGMELPGRQALFSKLSLDFEQIDCDRSASIAYSARVKDFDSRFNLLRTEANLFTNGAPLATADIRSFVRPASPTTPNSAIEAIFPSSETLKGKVALVTGASRGLGATIAQSLALQGCTVLVNFLKSSGEAKRLQETMADAPGKIELLQGDASDLSWCESAKETLIKTYGKLDYLICNACPPILPLWLEPSATPRINDYVSKSLALMSAPMATFLDVLSENSGWNVIISSVYSVQAAPTDLPHYVSAKCAIEGLARIAAAEYGEANFLIVRPPKLLTDQTNTPLSSQGSIPTEAVAVKIAQRLEGPTCSGHLDILENVW